MKKKGASIRMKMRFSENAKKAVIAFLGILSVSAACAACYVWTESFVKYEKVPSEKNTDAVESTANASRVTDLSDLPYSDYYTLRLENGKIRLYGADGTEIYCENDFSPDALSARDKAELERDGLVLASRSDVIEILTYLKS